MKAGTKLEIAALAAAVLAGCALTSGREREALQNELTTLFYSDLGPDAIDVSDYPEERRRQYKVYARACSECHSLARSVNSPPVSEEYWRFYVEAMRRRTRSRPGPRITDAEARAIVEFLDFDSRGRRASPEFAATTAALRKKLESGP